MRNYSTFCGKVVTVGPTQQIVGRTGNTVNKRILTIDASEVSATGTLFQNTPEFEFVGDSACDSINTLAVGQYVKVFFAPTGRAYIDRNGQQRIFTTNKAFNADVIDAQQPVAQEVQASQPQPAAYASTPQPAPQQPAYAPQPQPQYGQQPTQYGNQRVELPF